MKNILTIAGSDSGGGAGIQADIKTFAALGTYGMSAITAITAQNTIGVYKVKELDTEIIKAQIDAVFRDIRVDAVKIGMVCNVDIIRQLVSSLQEWGAVNIVLDPVMISTSGFQLLKPEAIEALKNELFPLAAVVTPNIPEAEVLSGEMIINKEDMVKAAKAIVSFGCKSVLIKGGHLEGDACDLFFDGEKVSIFTAPRITKKNTHGTGCTLSSAIAAYLVLGFDLTTAVSKSKEYLTGAIEHGFSLGGGEGPVHHFYKFYDVK